MVQEPKDEAVTVPKGSSISTWQPELIVPLYVSDIPRDLELPMLEPKTVSPPEKKLHSYSQRILRAALDIEKASLVVALELSTTDRPILIDRYLQKESSRRGSDKGYCSSEFHHLDLIDEAFQFIKKNPSFALGSLIEWHQLIRGIIHDILFAFEDHPLLRYADTVVPKLSEARRQDVKNTLQLHYKRHSPLALQKILRERYQEPRVVAVLLGLTQPRVGNQKPPKSCLPTARLELLRCKDQTTVQLTNLFDSRSDCEYTVPLCPTIDDSSVEYRDACMQQQFHRSCTCLRCRYEFFPTAATLASSSVSDLLDLGRHYMGISDTVSAEAIFQHLLQLEGLDDGDKFDVLHALGAIALRGNHFVKAQKIWKSAQTKAHPGLALQHEKLMAYKYLDEDNNNCPNVSAPQGVSWKSPVPGVFVATLVCPEDCEKVIEWAEKCNLWQGSRHYAVPTFDIPVHSAGVPLLPWFINFMQSTMQPSFVQLFGAGRYHVHDAFCVRYDGTSLSSYLPLHTDESTHSFVLALNEGGGKDYEGGGTYFFEGDKTIHLATGSVLCFRGDELLHGGEPVTRGSRYILAVFLYKSSAGNLVCRKPEKFENNEAFAFSFLNP